MAGRQKRLRRDKLQDIKREVEKIRLQDLPQETLRQMDQELTLDQEHLRLEADAIRRQLQDELERGHGSGISEHKKEIRHLARQHDELNGERAKVFDALQHRILEDRMIRFLGSKLRVMALELFIMGLIFFVLGLLVWDLSDPSLSLETRQLFSFIDLGACVIFMAEFFLKHRFADSKRWYWRRHWIDFITSIWIPNFEALRIGRLARVARIARLARAARLLRLLRAVFFFWRGMDKLQDVFDVKMMKRSVLLTVIFLLLGAGVIYAVEGGAGHEGVESFGESLWWSFTTVVTGGFGDIRNPTTLTGKILTVLLIIAGMVVVGIFTATLTSVLVGDESEALERMQKGLGSKLDELGGRLDQLESTPDQTSTGQLVRRRPEQ